MAFFATSHGKNACNGIGGTIKPLPAYASLQGATKGQTLTLRDLYKFATEQLPGIKSFYVSSGYILSFRDFLEKHFQDGKTIPGTQSHHCFCPTPYSKTIQISVVSGDEKSELTFASKVDHCNLHVSQYIICLYQNNWFAGSVNNISVPNGDAEVNFMHLKGPSHSFKWP